MSMSKWVKGEFESKTASGPRKHKGYINGEFGISKYRSEWDIYHLPTGCTFAYSRWPSLGDARWFADALIARGPWPFRSAEPRAVNRFNRACDDIADAAGIDRRRAK